MVIIQECREEQLRLRKYWLVSFLLAQTQIFSLKVSL